MPANDASVIKPLSACEGYLPMVIAGVEWIELQLPSAHARQREEVV
jgi:hypothetical protein